MKKVICILTILISNSYADYISAGLGDSKAEAYLNAMTSAPSGNHWALKRISYSGGYGGSSRYTCNIVWEQK